jgi:hypothetical protein
MVSKQATYRFCEILRSPDASGQAVPSLRMTTIRLEDRGEKKAAQPPSFPLSFFLLELSS